MAWGICLLVFVVPGRAAGSCENWGICLRLCERRAAELKATGMPERGSLKSAWMCSWSMVIPHTCYINPMSF